MKKVAKGFTLIELMIVVAIIGILAAIAIPNFLRYQLRSKFGELKINVEALRTSEEALHQSERTPCQDSATGAYLALTPVPVAATLNGSKTAWDAATDTAAAAILDWAVEGATYGQYGVLVGAAVTAPAGGTNNCSGANALLGDQSATMTILGTSDIDDDDVDSSTVVWKGGPVATGFAPASGAIDVTNCPGGTRPATIGEGQVYTCSGDNVF